MHIIRKYLRMDLLNYVAYYTPLSLIKFVKPCVDYLINPTNVVKVFQEHINHSMYLQKLDRIVECRSPYTMSGENIQDDGFPSEIIADEYLHTDNGNGIVYIFRDENNEENVQDAKTAIEGFGFNVKTTNLFPIETREQVLDTVDKITGEDYSHCSCFVLLFFGTIKGQKEEEYTTKSGDTILGAELWRKIMSCKTLKYRPKIFIYHAFKKLIHEQVDAARFVAEPKYDIPIESDMLVVYKVTEAFSANSSYFKNVWRNINCFGGRDDLMNIISYSERDKTDTYVPITVSTLRKKFYVTPSQYRLHWYDINKNTEKMLNMIMDLKITLSEANSQDRYNESPQPPNDGNDKNKRKMGNPKYAHVRSKVGSFRKGSTRELNI